MIANNLFNSMNSVGHGKDYFGFDLDIGFLSLSLFLYILFFMENYGKTDQPKFITFFTLKLILFWMLLNFRYKVGQRFGRHIDESTDLGEGKSTHYTLLIYLSGGLKPKAKNDVSSPNDPSSEPLAGGETVFYGSRNAVVAEVNYFDYFLFCPTFFVFKFVFLLD